MYEISADIYIVINTMNNVDVAEFNISSILRDREDEKLKQPAKTTA